MKYMILRKLKSKIIKKNIDINECPKIFKDEIDGLGTDSNLVTFIINNEIKINFNEYNKS